MRTLSEHCHMSAVNKGVKYCLVKFKSECLSYFVSLRHNIEKTFIKPKEQHNKYWYFPLDIAL